MKDGDALARPGERDREARRDVQRLAGVAATRSTHDPAHRLGRLAQSAQRSRHGHAVPALDDTLSRRTEAEHRAPARDLVERERCHREQRGCAAVDVDDPGAEPDAFRYACERAERYERVAAPGLRHEQGFVTALFGRARECDDLSERAVVHGAKRDPDPRHPLAS